MKDFDEIWDVTYLRRWIARFRLRARARAALLSLCPQYLSMRELERLLGVSQGYLCRLSVPHGVAVPSPALVAMLALLARDPARIDELREMWEPPPEPLRGEANKPDNEGGEPS
jgi:hypothetical protein